MSGKCEPPPYGSLVITDIAGGQIGMVRNHVSNRFAHRTQMDGHVGSIDHQVAIGGEDGAAEIESFFDIDADGGPLQRDPHLFGDPAKGVVENFQLGGIGRAVLGNLSDPCAPWVNSNCPSLSVSHVQPGATSVTVIASAINAGPSNWSPGSKCGRWYKPASTAIDLQSRRGPCRRSPLGGDCMPRRR